MQQALSLSEQLECDEDPGLIVIPGGTFINRPIELQTILAQAMREDRSLTNLFINALAEAHAVQ